MEPRIFTEDNEADQREIREMVLMSYQDMKEGKGRDYKEFFAELENKYQQIG